MMQDFKIEKSQGCPVEIKEDSSAAKGIASRGGLEKLKHVGIKELLVQEKFASEDIKITKVPGTENLADALTKYCEQKVLEYHMEHTHQELMVSSHHLAPSLE